MERSNIKHLYYIVHLDNLPSILKLGIICHNKVGTKKIADVSNSDVQKRRAAVEVPGTNKPLHDFANLYFNPRNAMMFVRKDLHEDLCVLAVSSSIIDLPNAIITDGNAASGATIFLKASTGLSRLSHKGVMTKDWRDEDSIVMDEKRRVACAEILIPDRVDPGFFREIYVSCTATKTRVINLLGTHNLSKHVVVNADMFFQQEES